MGFALADAGYDVWLGNLRGNRYSKSHAALSSKSPKFWAWSWDEMASLDIPAMVKYISSNTSSRITLVGYSQGATVGLAAVATNPDLMVSVNAIVALAPITSLKRSKSPLVRAFKSFTSTKLWQNAIGTPDMFSRGGTRFLTLGCLMLPDMCAKVPVPYDTPIHPMPLLHQAVEKTPL